MPTAAPDRPPGSPRSSCLLAVLVLLASPANGQGALTPGAFEAMSEGRTLHFTHLGAPYGAEQFFPGRRSLWRYADGTCTEGRWWDEAGAICFRYADEPAPQCWRFLPRPAGLAAELVEDGAGTGFVVEMSHADAEPLPCPGPKVGS